jgi:hypothetical protein
MSGQSGKCLCGAVLFECDGVEAQHHACHCKMCRRWSGGPLLAARVGKLTIEGQENIGTYSSSDWAERGFCRQCGSNLYYHFKPADAYWVPVGLFDDSSPFRLVSEVFIDHKPEGYAFAGDLPGMTEAEVIEKFSQTDS